MSHRAKDMLLCDACNDGYHYTCLDMPSLPDMTLNWFCPSCVVHHRLPAPLPADPADTRPERRHSLFRSSEQRKAFDTAQKYNNTQVYRRTSSGLDRATIGTATLRTDPDSLSSKYPLFNVSYPNHPTETDVRLTPIRNRQVHVIAYVSSTSATSWDLRQLASLQTALQQLMPGSWTARHVSQLRNQLDTFYSQPATALPCVTTMPAEIQPLLDSIDFTHMGGIIDPFAGRNSIAAAFRLHLPHSTIITNDLNPDTDADYHTDALSPSFYYRLHSLTGVDAIVTSPWFSLLDLAIPLAVSAVRVVACVHVPGHYLTSAHSPRVAFLQHLIGQQRMHIIWNLPRGPTGRRCAWLLIFASATLRNYFTQHMFPHSVSCTYTQMPDSSGGHCNAHAASVG